MDETKEVASRKSDWIVALSLGAIAALTYFIGLADYAFPGESAHLQVLWKGLDTAGVQPHPLMGLVARLFGGGNLLAPVCGTLSAVLLYFVTAFFVRERANGEYTARYAVKASRVAGVVSTILFVFTPAVREAATHLEPRLFDATLALGVAALAIPYAHAARGWIYPWLMGALTGLGMADSLVFLALLPLYAMLVSTVCIRRERPFYTALAAFLVGAIAAFFLYAPHAVGDFKEFWPLAWGEFKALAGPGWLFVALFTTLPFVTSLFSSYKAYNEPSGVATWLFHIAMSFVAVLAIATQLSPSAQMAPMGVLPVVTSAFAAFVAGYLAAYWTLQVQLAKVNAEGGPSAGVRQIGRAIAFAVGGMLALVFLVTICLNLFSFDAQRGAFADKLARKILADLGDRTWFISDGSLDDHLRLEAAKTSRELNLVCLRRDLDPKYLETLAKVVREKKIGGDKNESLALQLTLGVLPFVQDWFAGDSNVVNEVAVFGAPDLWYAAGHKAVPEFAFFGGNPARKIDWAADWKAFNEILFAPKGWGSYRNRQDAGTPMDALRLALRRHLGLIRNNIGVALQTAGDAEGAFAAYASVLDEIDCDNVSAMFNIFELGSAGKVAAAKRRLKDIERELKSIVEDQNRRYYIWQLGNVYGYICNWQIFKRLGYVWARSGCPGEALSQIRRAIDFVPDEQRASLLNMMAALYANDNDTRKSRETFDAILSVDARNHDALIGMMRLELAEGNTAKAIDFLSRAAEASDETARGGIERAMLHLMKGELADARKLLRTAVEGDRSNLQAWSLMAAVTMQQIDAEKDETAKAALVKELESDILPTMEKQARSPYDYYVQTTKAFVLMRQGADEKKRRAARDAFVVASKSRPDIAATHDLVLGLDISLNDQADAERHAREVLRRNRKAPLANYVMGSLALGKGNYAEAENFLRRAADAPKPVTLAQNDLAEALRRQKKFVEAESYARKAVKNDPSLYVAWETLGAILMDQNKCLDEAETCVKKACELSKGKNGREEDVRMLMSLARVQLLNENKVRAKATLRNVGTRLNELSEFEKGEYEELSKRVK